MFEKYSFSGRFQDLLLACIIKHPEKFICNAGTLSSAYFLGTERVATARALFAHFNKHGRLPSMDMAGDVIYSAIARTTDEKSEPEIMDYVKKLLEHETDEVDYVVNEVVHFAQERAIYCAIQNALTYHSSGESPPGGYAKLFEEAMKVGFNASSDAGKSLADYAQGTVDKSQTLLGVGRFLCRGGGMLQIAYTGVGKSTCGVQQDMLWSLGRPAFGIEPNGPLRILGIQAENDDGDLIETAKGIAEALDLTPADLEQIKRNTRYVYHTSSTGDDFLNGVVARELAARPYDLLRLDPLMAYVGGDITKPEVIAKFLRNGLNPLLRRYGCGAVINHHTPKPTAESVKMKRKLHEWIYAAAGSYDLMGWARAAMVIAATEDPMVFKFIAAKRGGRLGWTDDDGRTAYETYWAHSPDPDRIAWVKATRAQIRALATTGKRGPKEQWPADDLLQMLRRAGPLSYDRWLTLAQSHDWSEATFKRKRRELEESGMIVDKDGAWIAGPNHAENDLEPQAHNNNDTQGRFRKRKTLTAE